MAIESIEQVGRALGIYYHDLGDAAGFDLPSQSQAG
jgi:hypothetical protein